MTWLTVTIAVIAAGCRLWNTYWVQALYWGMIRIFPLIFIVVLKGREYLLHSRDSRGEAYSENLSNLPKTTQCCPSPSLCLGLLYWELFIQRDFVSRRCAFYLSTASQLFPFFLSTHIFPWFWPPACRFGFPRVVCRVTKEESMDKLQIRSIPEANRELVREPFVKWKRQRGAIWIVK